MKCCRCGGPASYICIECRRTFCDASGCTATKAALAAGKRWGPPPARTIHTHGVEWYVRPIEPIPDDRVFKTGPLMRATAPPPAPIERPVKTRRLDLESPASVQEWMERERGGRRGPRDT